MLRFTKVAWKWRPRSLKGCHVTFLNEYIKIVIIFSEQKSNDNHNNDIHNRLELANHPIVFSKMETFYELEYSMLFHSTNTVQVLFYFKLLWPLLIKPVVDQDISLMQVSLRKQHQHRVQLWNSCIYGPWWEWRYLLLTLSFLFSIPTYFCFGITTKLQCWNLLSYYWVKGGVPWIVYQSIVGPHSDGLSLLAAEERRSH